MRLEKSIVDSMREKLMFLKKIKYLDKHALAIGLHFYMIIGYPYVFI